jgi:hypothetical protein
VGHLVAAAGITRASPITDLLIGLFLIALGSVLGFDVKGISSTFHRNTSSSLRGTKKRDYDPWRGLNPFKLGGWGFLGIGIIILVFGATNIA